MKPLVAVAASLLVLLSGCVFTPIAMSKNVDLIFQVEFSQSQAVLGFDDGTYTIDEDSPSVQAFRELLKKHDVKPWEYTSVDADGCAGGITTTARVLMHGTGEDTMVINGCAAADGSFEQEATDFFSTIREGRSHPNSDITGVTFSQSQAVLGFDDSEHTQSDPAELTRFVAVLDQFDVTWWSPAGVTMVFLSASGEPCAGGITTTLSVAYADGTETDPVTIDGCAQQGDVQAGITDLLSEWREG